MKRLRERIRSMFTAIAMLANDVYYSFVRRICLLGGESTGKHAFKSAGGRAYTVYVANLAATIGKKKTVS
ncbi:MAG: hypothetical protein ACLRXB_01245 [Escherichia coli]